jgi:hypothetical protein
MTTLHFFTNRHFKFWALVLTDGDTWRTSDLVRVDFVDCKIDSRPDVISRIWNSLIAQGRV